MKKIKINVWDKFWRLSIKEELPRFVKKTWKKLRYFKCTCECWGTCKVLLENLRSWNTKSCWCLNKEIMGLVWKSHKWLKKEKTFSDTKVYQVWTNIKSRCYNKNKPWYEYWWWRWIKCEWNSFKEFNKDMWPTYKEWLTIERIDVNWNYCKDNCTWIPKSEQPKNRRTNFYIEYNWRTETLSEWARILWIKRRTLSQRIHWYWWTINKAFNN